MDFVSTKTSVLSFFAIMGASISSLLGGWDAPLILLVGMMVVDFITGLLIGLFWNASPKTVNGGLSSQASFKGLCKKFVILMMVWIGTLMDGAMGTDYIRTAVVLFFIGNEGLSVLENLGIMGLKYPPVIKNALEVMMEKSESTEVK